MSKADFDDYDLDENAGILDSAGLKDYNNIQTKLGKEGAEVYLNCRRCNKPKRVTVEWQELATIAANGVGAPPVLPQGWQYSQNNGSTFFALRCPNCNSDQGVAVHITPEEAQKHMRAGIQANLVSSQYAQQVAAQVHQLQQSRRR